jgi:predicted PurR-regulated permease PerM
LIYLLVLVIIITLAVVFAPPLVSQLTELNLDLQRVFNQLGNWLIHPIVIAGQVFDLQAFFQSAVGSLQVVLEPFFSRTLSLLVEVISSLVWVIFIVVVSFYLVKDGPRLRLWLENSIPPDYRSDYIHLRDEIGLIWAAFFRGQIVLALVVGTIITTASFILGLPFALAGFARWPVRVPPQHRSWHLVGHRAQWRCSFGSTWLPLPSWAFMLMVIGLPIYQQFDLNT